MRDRFALNIVLFGAIVALVAIAYWLPGHHELAKLPLVSSLQAEAVHSIDLQRRAQQSVSFVRNTGDSAQQWVMITPSKGPANAEKVAALLNILQTRSTATVPADELQRFELDQPRVSLQFNDETWSFGASHPLDGRRYVLHNGVVHLVDDRFFHHLIAEPQIYMAPVPVPDKSLAEPIDPAADPIARK
jgi:hypothetical protein